MINRVWDVTLTVSDLGRAIEFYRDLLGLPLKCAFRDYVGFDVGGVELGLKTWGGLEPPRRGEPVVSFLVDAVDKVYAELSAKGVRFTKAPEDTPWGGRIAVFQDPDGNTLQLTQLDWQKYFKACAG